MLVPNDNAAPKSNRVKSQAQAVDFASKEVLLNSGEKLAYDYLVIASGALSKAPVEPPVSGADERAYYEDVAAKIDASKRVLIVGGGPVGIELAGEIKAKHKSKEISIVTHAEAFCHKMGFSKEVSDQIQSELSKQGIKCIFNHSVDLGQDASAQMLGYAPAKDFGELLGAFDLVINATGARPNTAWIDKSKLTSSGHVKVNEYLQVEGLENVFAIGDCNNVPEPKNFTTCGSKTFMEGFPLGQADIAAENIKHLAQGNPVSEKYKPNNQYRAGLIPIGPSAAVAVGMPQGFADYMAQTFFYHGQWAYAKAGDAPELPAL